MLFFTVSSGAIVPLSRGLAGCNLQVGSKSAKWDFKHILTIKCTTATLCKACLYNPCTCAGCNIDSRFPEFTCIPHSHNIQLIA